MIKAFDCANPECSRQVRVEFPDPEGESLTLSFTDVGDGPLALSATVYACSADCRRAIVVAIGPVE